jgi:hypothetical protein
MKSSDQYSTQAAELRPDTFAPQSTRSTLGSFVDWLLGAHLDKQEPAWPKPNEPQIVVAAPSEHNSWVDSFNAAFTEAATTFICRHVEPYHREDPTAGYAVTRVKVGIKDASAACLRAIQSMPAGMRDRIVLLRIKKAKGSEQLAPSTLSGDHHPLAKWFHMQSHTGTSIPSQSLEFLQRFHQWRS